MDTISYAHESITVADTAIGFTSTTYTRPDGIPARRAFITVENASIRFLCTGGDPVAGTTGHLVISGEKFTISGEHDLKNFKAIRESSTSAVIKVTYEGEV